MWSHPWAQSARLGVVRFVQAFAALNVAAANVGFVMYCEGPSMEPTIRTAGQYVLYETISLRQQKLEPGDVVIAVPPYDPRKMVAKRIVGMPGDVIRAPATNPWQSYRMCIVPPGHVWLQGDNLPMSNDSRSYGPVPIDMILGRVFFRVRDLAWLTPTLEYSGNARLAELPDPSMPGLSPAGPVPGEYSPPQRPSTTRPVRTHLRGCNFFCFF